MQFYFIDEENWSTMIDGTNKEILEQVIKLCNNQERHTGFLGVLDITGRIRGTIIWTTYSNTHLKLSTFIRKYRAIESLETLSKAIKEDIAKGLIK